jgi:hypothetical protein
MPDGSLGGPWNYTNAASFIRYTVSKGYDVHGWELGMLNLCNLVDCVGFVRKKERKKNLMSLDSLFMPTLFREEQYVC